MSRRYNSVKIDRRITDKRLVELDMYGEDVGKKLGRCASWYSGLCRANTSVYTAKALANILGMELEDIIYDPDRDKKQEAEEVEVQEQMEIQQEDADIKDLANKIIELLGKIGASLETIANAQSVEQQGEMDLANVLKAESVLRTMLESTGETNARKYKQACDSRGITDKERHRAVENTGAQYQWRRNDNGTKKCYIVKGC